MALTMPYLTTWYLKAKPKIIIQKIWKNLCDPAEIFFCISHFKI